MYFEYRINSESKLHIPRIKKCCSIIALIGLEIIAGIKHHEWKWLPNYQEPVIYGKQQFEINDTQTHRDYMYMPTCTYKRKREYWFIHNLVRMENLLLLI